MKIFEKNMSYTCIVISYLKLRILKPLVLYGIFCATSHTFNPFYFNEIAKYPFFLYLLVFIFNLINRTRFYIQSIDFDKVQNEVIFLVKSFNENTLYTYELNELLITVNSYELITRTTNFYLSIKSSDTDDELKQYDYGPWTHEKIKEVYQILSTLKNG